jgi:hypothetical protein
MQIYLIILRKAQVSYTINIQINRLLAQSVIILYKLRHVTKALILDIIKFIYQQSDFTNVKCIVHSEKNAKKLH